MEIKLTFAQNHSKISLLDFHNLNWKAALLSKISKMGPPYIVTRFILHD